MIVVMATDLLLMCIPAMVILLYTSLTTVIGLTLISNQISMNALRRVIDVFKIVKTLLDHTLAVATMAIVLTAMDTPAMVSYEIQVVP